MTRVETAENRTHIISGVKTTFYEHYTSISFRGDTVIALGNTGISELQRHTIGARKRAAAGLEELSEVSIDPCVDVGAIEVPLDSAAA